MSSDPRVYVNLRPGDPAPWFTQRSGRNPSFVFDTAAGRYLVLGFVGSADEAAQRALAAVKARTDVFDDRHASFFAVTLDPTDEREGRLADRAPGFRVLWDFDTSVHRLYGAAPRDPVPGERGVAVRRFFVVLDPTLRVLATFPFEVEAMIDDLARRPPPGRWAGIELQAPVLFLPDVFEPEFCRTLIGLYEAHGGIDTGFMREVDGKTVGLLDPAHKVRQDYVIEDEETCRAARARVNRRISPEIAKIHQFTATRMERYIVSCYAAESGGHFRAHRDNTTKGTAHRRFAVSINLNEGFEGGEIVFPEYGPRGLTPPVGGAVVFSCSLLHAVTPVTRGRRYAFLPFLYDEAAAKLREENNEFLDAELGAYRR
jgi:predicted 2-oxoglutarate/Fe(II)-dependent dioxygenase YbiX/peroxiredoxin